MILLTCLLIILTATSGHHPVPGGHQFQYYLQHPDGAYKYGYDTGTGYHASQHADQRNQVQGQYAYRDQSGYDVGLKYTAGVQGFVPTGYDYTGPPEGHRTYSFHSEPMPTYAPQYGVQHLVGPNPDGSYSFSYSTRDQGREEQADSGNNVRGSYWYINNAGRHDLSYIASEATGFQPTGGSLATPNAGVGTREGPIQHHSFSYNLHPPRPNPSPMFTYAPQHGHQPTVGPNIDGTYGFAYQGRQEQGYPRNDVKGNSWFINDGGRHDLSYIGGVPTGFQPTGGNIGGQLGIATQVKNKISWQSDPVSVSDDYPDTTDYLESTGDASYNFRIDTDSYRREESSDQQGNIQGIYSYKNKDGNFGLSYSAGSKTGFVPTGGNLASPENRAKSAKSYSSGYAYPYSNIQTAGDASYSFSIDTNDYQRQESSDAEGNVEGKYSYQNEAGIHDLTYKASPETGFLVTGGSLSVPNGLKSSEEVEEKHEDELKALPLIINLPSPIHSEIKDNVLLSVIPLVKHKRVQHAT